MTLQLQLRLCNACGDPLPKGKLKYCKTECQKAAARAAHIKTTYGITLAEWDQILKYQGGRCAVCRREPRKGETFHLDHEHSNGPSGRVRGILCPYCNTRLVGRLRDHEKAANLASYLKDPPAIDALGREVIAPGRPRKKRQPRKKARA